MILERAERFRLKHWHSRNKRCLVNSSGYEVTKHSDETRPSESLSGEYRIFYQKSTIRNPQEIIEIISEYKKTSLQEPQKLFKNTHNRKIAILPFDKRTVFVKEYNFSFTNKILSAFGINPARREWFSANGLKVRKILTPEPLALVEEYNPFFQWVVRGYLITEAVVDTQQTNSYLMDNFVRYIRDRAGFQDKIRFIREFAYAIKRLHQRRIFHADLKVNNILVSSPSVGTAHSGSRPETTQGRGMSLPLGRTRTSPTKFYVLDLDRVRFSQELLLEERIKNLAQLNASTPEVLTRADRLRFYRLYSYGEKEMPQEEERMLIKRIIRATIKRHHFWPPSY